MKKSAHIYTFYGIAVVVLLLVLYVFVHKKAVYNPVVEMKRSAMLDELEEEKKKKEEKQKDEEQWKDGDRKDAEKENTERAGNMDGGMSTPYGGMAARDMYTNMYGVPPASTPANEYYYPGTGPLPQDDSYTAMQPQFNNIDAGPMGPPTNDSNGQMSKESEETLDSIVQDPMFNLTMFMGMLNRMKDLNKDGADEDDSKSYVGSRFVPPTLITLPGRYNLGLRRPGESIFGENVGSQLGVDSVSTGTGGPLGSSYENMPGARVPDTDSENASESLGQSLFGEDKKKKDEKSVVPSMFADMGVLGGDDKDKKKEESVSPSFTGITALGNDKDKKKEESVSPSYTGITALGNDKDKKKEESVSPSYTGITALGNDKDKKKEESVSPSFTGITALGNDKDKKKDHKGILPPPFTDTSSDSERDDGKRKGSDDAMFLPLDDTPAMDRNGGEKPNDSAVSSIFGVAHISDDKKDKKKKDENSILPSLTGTSALGKDDKDKDKKKKDEKSVLPSPFSDMSILNKDKDDKNKKDKKKDEKSILPSPFFNTSVLDKDKDDKKKKKDEKSILPSPFFNTSVLDKDKDDKKKKKDEKSILPSPFFNTSVLDKDKDDKKKKKDEKSVLPSPFFNTSILDKEKDDKKKKKDEKSVLPSPFFNTSVLDKNDNDKDKKKDEKSTSPLSPSSVLDKDKDEKKKKKDENNTLPFSIFGTKHSQRESNNRNETSPSSQDRMSGTGTKASDRTDSSTKENNVPMAGNDKTKDRKRKKDEQPMVDRVVKQAIFVAIGSSGNDKGRGMSGDSGMNGALRNVTTNSSIGNSSNNGTSDRTSTDTMNRSVPSQNGHESPAEQDLLNFSILDNNRDSSSPSTDSNLPKDSLQEKTHKRKQKDEGRTDKKFLDSYDLFSSIDDAKKDKRDNTETVGDKYDVTGEVPVKSDALLTNGGIIKPENSLSTGNEPEGSSGQPSKSQKTGNMSNKNRISANYTESTPIFRDLPTYTNKNKKSKPRSKQVVPIIKFKELKDEMDGMDRLIDEVKDIREMKERSFDDMLGSIVRDGKGPEDKKENGSDKSEAFDLGEKLAFRKVPSTNTSSDAPAVVVTPEQPAVNQEKNPEVTLNAIPKKRVHRRIKHKSHKKRKNAPPKKSEPVVNEQGFFDFFMPGTNTEGDNKDQGERTSHKHHKGKKKHKVSQEISNDSTPGEEHVLVANGYQKALKGDTLRTGQEKVKRETTSRNIVEINSDDYGKEMVS